MNEQSNYHTYRYHISSTHTYQGSLFQDPRSKEQIMIDFFDMLIERKKSEFRYKNKRHVIYGKQNVDQKIYVLTLAKNIKEKKYIEGDEDVIEEEDESMVFVRMFVNPETQIILVQNKTSAFTSTEATIKRFADHANKTIYESNYVVQFHPLSSYASFWDTVYKARYIYSFSATLNAPNMLFGNQDTREALKMLKEETNIDSVTIDLESQDGRLDLKKGTWLDRAITHITTVGGRLKLKYRISKDLPIENKTSLDDVRKVSIPEEKEYTDVDLSDIENKIKSIDETSKNQSDEPNT